MVSPSFSRGPTKNPFTVYTAGSRLLSAAAATKSGGEGSCRAGGSPSVLTVGNTMPPFWFPDWCGVNSPQPPRKANKESRVHSTEKICRNMTDSFLFGETNHAKAVADRIFVFYIYDSHKNSFDINAPDAVFFLQSR